MRVGFALPNIGPLGSRESIRRVAERAEALGYESLWTVERLLYPEKPRTPYAATPDGSLPEPYKYSLDPIETLTFAAAFTSKVALGTSVINIPFYNPVVLARRLTTLDIVSNGRLRVSFGLGWSQDEIDAVGAKMSERGRRADEFLQVLETIWTADPAEFHGDFFELPRSHFGHKPVQKPHPPIYMAAFAPPALARIAKRAQGWNPVAIPVEGMKQMFGGLLEMAEKEGRDPSELEMIVRANIELSDEEGGENRMIFTGTEAQIRSDIDGCRAIGAAEIFFDPTFQAGAQDLDRWIDLMETIRGWV